jgi:hypothetical protein
VRVGVVVGQEAPTVSLGEDPGVAPLVALERPHVEYVDHEYVARLRTVDGDRPAQHVALVEIDPGHVVGGVRVPDLLVGPFLALDPVAAARIDR